MMDHPFPLHATDPDCSAKGLEARALLWLARNDSLPMALSGAVTYLRMSASETFRQLFCGNQLLLDRHPSNDRYVNPKQGRKHGSVLLGRQRRLGEEGG